VPNVDIAATRKFNEPLAKAALRAAVDVVYVLAAGEPYIVFDDITCEVWLAKKNKISIKPFDPSSP